MEMKNLTKAASIYIVPYKRNKYIFLSNLTGKVIIGDSSLKNVIEHPQQYLSTKLETLKYIFKNGFIVNSRAEEDKILSKNIENVKRNIPLNFVISLTYNCNFNCEYCFQGHSSIISLNKSDIGPLIDFIKKKFRSTKDDKFVLVFTGGEPLLKFDLIQEIVLKLEKEIGRNYFKLRLITNGSLLSEDKCEFFAKRDWVSTQITLDGTEKYHNKMRPYNNGKGTFQKVITGINNALKNSKEVVLRINVWPQNVKGIYDLLDYLQEDGYKEKNNLILGFHPVLNYFEAVKDKLCELVYSETQWSKHALEFYDLARNKGFRNIDLPLSFPRLIYCGATSFKVFHILPDGRIATCWAVGGGMDNFVIGSIHGETKKEYLENIERLKNYNPFKQEKCKNCKVSAFCGGGCLAQAISNNGDMEKSICSYIANDPEEHLIRFVEERLRKGKISNKQLVK